MANLHCICGQRPHMQCHWFSQWRVSMIHQLCLLKRSYNRTNCCAEILVAVYLFCTFLKCSVSHSKYGLYVRYYEFFCNNGGTAVKLNTWNLKKNKKRGFTLIELIIVIVILAVLMAVAIPSLTGYINEAKTTGKIVECRQAVTAAQTTAIRHYGATRQATNGAADATFISEVVTLSEIPAGAVINNIMCSNNTVSELSYTNDGITVLYKDGKYTIVDGASGGTPARPADTLYSTSVLDPIKGEYVDVKVTGNVIGANNVAVRYKIVYFEGNSKYDAGYYYINSWEYHIPMNNENIDAYLDKITNNGVAKSSFVKVNPDAPITYYDPEVETGKKLNKDNNTSVKAGQFYYMNFTWDDNPEPVLALFIGANSDVGYRGDLQGTSYSTNKGLWVLASDL